MATRAKNPFETKTPMSQLGKATYEAIASRLAQLNPPVVIANHIAETETPGKAKQFSTLQAHDSTLDGVNFVAVNPAVLVRELEHATDKWGERAFASMREDPDHWALKASFGKTVGTGWRETWREAPYRSSAATPSEPGKADNVMRMRFGTAGSAIRFSALHCAVHEIGAQCNFHIDEEGFVLELPFGFGLTPSLYSHFMNELLLKTDFRNWLSGQISNEKAAEFVRSVLRRTSLVFPSAANGFAGLENTLNSIRRPKGLRNGLWTAARIFRPIGFTFDAYETDAFKVQVTGSFVRGDRSITLTLGGEW